MGRAEQPTLTNSQVKKAGDALRHALRERGRLEMVSNDTGLGWAWDIASAFQQEHIAPTIQFVSAASYVARDFGIADPVFRIKRLGRIIEKIARRSSSLHRLQDIGGCRIVVADLRMQAQVTEALLRLEYPLEAFDDYVWPADTDVFAPLLSRGPQGSGYRAVHLVHEVGGRLVETQVRTETQHGWAVAVERAEQMTSYPMKFGEGPTDLLGYFTMLSRIQALQEFGADVDSDLVEDITHLGERILEYYRRSGSS